MTHRALIVAAVSTPGQATDDKASIPEQLARCRAACASHGWQVVAEVTIPGHSRNYDDLAELVASSPEYGEIIRTVTAGTVSLVVAYASDRLWRTDALRASVTAICRRHGVQVYTVSQPIEPMPQDEFIRYGNEGARWLEAVGGLVSESENTARVRRMITGKRGVIQRGGVSYGRVIPYGYIKDKPQHIEPDPIKAPIVRRIFDWRVSSRMGLHAITRELNDAGIAGPNGGVWHHNAVRRILHNPVYRGASRWGGAVNENANHEPLVTPELWQAAQSPLVVYRPREYAKPLQGLCRCGFCGAAMAYDMLSKPQRRYLRCGRYLGKGGRECQPNMVKAEPIERQVYEYVLDVLANPSAYLEARKQRDNGADTAREMAEIETELRKLELRKKRGFDAYDSGVIPLDEYRQHRATIDRRAHELQARRMVLAADAARSREFEAIVSRHAAMLAEWQAAPVERWHELLVGLVREVIITRGGETDIRLL